MDLINLPKQPGLLVSNWNVAKLLYGALFLFIVETIYYFINFKEAYTEQRIEIVLFWLWCLLFSFIHIFLVLMDIWSRFQNYKRVKDHLFTNGFTPKVAQHYAGSKCQRMALMAAAKELGMENDVKDYYSKTGVCWYHFTPKFIINDPLFLLKRHFWSRTFLEKYYVPKFDYRSFSRNVAKC